jgi:hypothetical protein
MRTYGAVKVDFFGACWLDREKDDVQLVTFQGVKNKACRREFDELERDVELRSKPASEVHGNTLDAVAVVSDLNKNGIAKIDGGAQPTIGR